MARATNPNVNFAIFLEDRIQTLEFNPDKVYVYESDDSTYTLGNSELIQEYLDGNNVSIVELDLLAGEEYQPPAAPPKLKPQRTLTATWASVKQK